MNKIFSNRFVMVWLIFFAVNLTLYPLASSAHSVTFTPHDYVNTDNQVIIKAYATRSNLAEVQGSGTVVKVLKDDKKGLKHQKFLLKINDNLTILIAHNIDLAPRIEHLQVGDIINFKGEYIYTPKGGTVHWTHKDPHGHHVAGYLEHKAKKYE